jgi:hypothetical protein
VKLWPRKGEFREVYVPSDYEFLEPGRPEMVYEDDLSPEQRARIAPQMEERKTALREHYRKLNAETGMDMWESGARFPDGRVMGTPPPKGYNDPEGKPSRDEPAAGLA